MTVNITTIGIGTGPDTNTGEPLRLAFTKINSNFANLKTVVDSVSGNVVTGNLELTGQFINGTLDNTDITLTPLGVGEVVVTGNLRTNYLVFRGNSITTQYAGDLVLNASAGNIALADPLKFPDGTVQYSASATANGAVIDTMTVTNLTTGNILPSANVAYSLGSADYQWKDLWVSNNTIYINSVPITVDENNQLIVGAGNTAANIATESYVDSAISQIQTFDQDLNTTNDVTFANIATTTGQISVPTDTSFAVRLNHSTFGEANVIVNSQGYMEITGGYTGTSFTQTQLGEIGPIGYFGFSGNVTSIDGINGLYITTGEEASGGSWQFGLDGTLSVPNAITGFQQSEMNSRIVLKPNSNLEERFLLYVDQSAGSFLRAGMEMPPAQIDKASTLGFPHANGNVGYLYSQGTDTGATEFNNAFNVMSNGADLKLSAFNSETRYVWKFDTSGNLTLPDNSTVSAGGSGGLTLGANFDVKIVADYTDNDRTWTFNGSDGSITLPGDGVTLDTNGAVDSGQFNITLPGFNSAEPQVFRFSDEGGSGEIVFPDGTRQGTAAVAANLTPGIDGLNVNGFVFYDTGSQTISANWDHYYQTNVHIFKSSLPAGFETTVDNTWTLNGIAVVSVQEWSGYPDEWEITLASNYTGGQPAVFSKTVSDAYIEFPDSTVQSTAYTGPQDLSSYATISSVANVASNVSTLQSQVYSDSNVAAYLSNYDGAINFTASPAIINNVGTITTLTANATTVNATTVNVTGNITGNVSGYAIGYRDVPQVAAGNVTLGITDGGKHYYSTASTTTTLTVPSNANVAFPVGTAITVVNKGTGTVTIGKQAEASLYLAGNSTSATRTLSSYGMATLLKTAADEWFITGTGLA